MIIKLDPRWPIVWRDPFTVQFGVDPPRVILTDLTTLEERMIAAVAVGVSREGLAMIAGGHLEVRDALLEHLAPVLMGPVRAAERATIAISGSGHLVDLSARLLGELGYHVLVSADASLLADSEPRIAVVVGHWVLPPGLHALWLRRDVTHIPVVFSDSAVQLGPIIEPGNGPCLLCIEFHRRDDDDAWPAIATQLLTRSAGAESPALTAEAAAALVRLIVERLERGPGAAMSQRIAITGEREAREWSAHPDCGCRGIESLAQLSSGR